MQLRTPGGRQNTVALNSFLAQSCTLLESESLARARERRCAYISDSDEKREKTKHSLSLGHLEPVIRIYIQYINRRGMAPFREISSKCKCFCLQIVFI